MTGEKMKALVDEITEAVYRERLGADDTRRMIAKDGVEKLREWSKSYETLTRAYLKVLREKGMLVEGSR